MTAQNLKDRMRSHSANRLHNKSYGNLKRDSSVNSCSTALHTNASSRISVLSNSCLVSDRPKKLSQIIQGGILGFLESKRLEREEKKLQWDKSVIHRDER